MQVITDEEILYDCYKKLAKNNEARNRKADLANDKNSVSRIASSTSLMITRLTETDLVIPAQEIQRYILGAKGLFLQCASIKRRHPNCIAESLDRSVDKMIQAVCKHEADMIEGLRQQEKDGDRIDIKMVFDQPRYLKQLGNMSARNIIAEAIDNENRYLSDSPPIYITRTGKKYHVANCPYCRGKDLNQATARIIRDNRLLPCKCVDSTHLQGELEHTFVTAFIDETIHPVNWDEKGNKGKAGSFSYILCWGKVTYESQITDQRF